MWKNRTIKVQKYYISILKHSCFWTEP